MSEITPEQFSDFFRELHGDDPYDWQCRLARRASEGNWPPAIDLPTGSGKTACLDIAVFALACQASLPLKDRTAPRRLFFCVNRRVIVDEAYQRAKRIARALWEAERNPDDDRSTLRAVAAALRIVAGTTSEQGTPPLDAIELRGGIYRDNRWARSATQPTIICTTLDQLGSRLLFRGYGVSQGAAPIQAALTAYDSLIFLDEAHISRPFLQTLQQVQRYLDADNWAEQDIGMAPTKVVPMTATPPEGIDDTDVIRLSEKDRANKSLRNRLAANKPAKLKAIPKKTKDSRCDHEIVRDEVVKQIIDFSKGTPAAIGIIVNRVATAKVIFKSLLDEQNKKNKPKIHPDTLVELVIGSMRPIDRDKQAQRLRELIGHDRPDITDQTSIVVATQCLEVGADYDFDVLITECASLDALRQRFGRLNRAGRQDGDGNPIEAKAVIVANMKGIKGDDKLDDAKPIDPIYGNALSRTWNWLNSQAANGTIDFGIDAFETVLQEHGENGRIPVNLLSPSASMNAPVMLPAYVDFWCQTSPKPVPDPDVSLFIHGPRSAEPDVQICLRADLLEGEQGNQEHWCDIVGMLPPTSAECISVPISRLLRWLVDRSEEPKDDSDLLAALATKEEDKQGDKQGDKGETSLRRFGVLWRGPKESKPKKHNLKKGKPPKETKIIESIKDLRPGDTLVLPTFVGEITQLGHIPPSKSEIENGYDVGETAFLQSRDRAAIRLHPSLRSRLPRGNEIDELFAMATNRDSSTTIGEWRKALGHVAKQLTESDEADFQKQFQALADSQNGLRIDRYADQGGVVLTTRKRLGGTTDWYIPAIDDGDDDASRTQRENPVLLNDHTQHVANKVVLGVALLPIDVQPDIFKTAAELHDLGKADERFQALLRRTDCTDAWLLAAHQSTLLAKSNGMPQTRSQRAAARRRSGLPKGFRHEMLSVQLAQQSGQLPEKQASSDLLLHLIAAHHGYARPFAPVVDNADPPDVTVNGIHMTADERLICPPHRIDSGIAERFWQLTRRYGWWGLAYLESVLRLADQQASAAEDAGLFKNENTKEAMEATA